MQQYRFWTTITVNGVQKRQEYVFDARTWTEARSMMSMEMKKTVKT